MATEANKAAFRAALEAAVDKYVKQQGRNTIMLNAESDPACAGYARIPGPDACDFCVTMGAANDFYHTQESAGGGAGHGTSDDAYHPYCNCQVVIVFEKRGVHVARDPETGEAVPYDGADMVRRYNEVGRPTYGSKGGGARSSSSVTIENPLDYIRSAQTVEEVEVRFAEVYSQYKRIYGEEGMMKRLPTARSAGRQRVNEIKNGNVLGDASTKPRAYVGTEANLNIEIDEYVPCLVRNSDGKVLPTVVSEAKDAELKGLNKRTGWFVNWQKDMRIDSETGRPIKRYKLMVEGSDEIQGLIGVIEPSEPGEPLRVSWAVANPKSQSRAVGSGSKEYTGIGGHLFAVACEKSEELGLGGEWIGFARNAELYEYYVERVGMDDIGGGIVAMSREKAKEIMQMYNYEWSA
ncbi:MAG: hypothetical protein IJI35_15320 [Kiritimatiellae bacterium]|nr:hypothetical protein [Kiritimatiellia bacterium]